MKSKLRFFGIGILVLSCWCWAKTEAPSLTLSDLPSILHDALLAHPGKGQLDEATLVRSHDRLFAQFDPEKTYLLEQEAAPYLDPKNAREYLSQYQRNDFRQYFAMIALCQKAIERSRKIRGGFLFTDSRSVDTIRRKPREVYTRYAMDNDELSGRMFRRYLRLVAARLPQDAEGDSEAVAEAVHLAEKELEDGENPWLKLRPQGSEESRSLVARLILKSILSALDVHSDVIEADGVRQMRERLTKEAFGTGIIPLISQTGCTIKKVVQGSPASRMKLIQERDQIVSIDGHLCSDMTQSEIEHALNQERAGTVRLVLNKASSGAKLKTVQVAVQRRRYTMLEGRLESEIRKTPQGRILILTLHSFYRGGPGVSSSEDVKRAFLDASRTGSIAGVVLDLRDNGGGYVAEAVRVVGEFITTGVVMAAQYADGTRLVFRDTDPEVQFSGPVVVVTSRATASAAEIVSQALKDYGRAVTVGDLHTYGKGSVQMQTVTDINEKDVWVNVPLRLTVGQYFTVSGYSPQSAGVTSDIIVPGVYDRPRPTEGESAGMPGRIQPMFKDSLDDVRLDARAWYATHYIPFVQQRTDQYRRWIPTLQKRSARRMEENPLWKIVMQTPLMPVERDTIVKEAHDLQMDEAVSIEEDLIQLSKSGL
jgi:carboxyl-terminal processing protease